MKYQLLSAFLALSTTVFGNTIADVTLYEQLVGLNKYWSNNNGIVCSSTATTLLNERDLIQTHLQLVEQELRKRETKHLNHTQKQNRQTALDILHQYWQEGIYPQNIYHTSRTPYFIDHLGTACAVGQLIIETGHEEIAKKISSDNNYGLIEQMNYPELISWANIYGFTVEELKWIQPTYCYNTCPPDSLVHVSCHGGMDGCVGMSWGELPIGEPGTVFMFDGCYHFNEETKEWYSLWDCCELSAGYYKIVWVDEFDTDYNIFFDILEPEEIYTASYLDHAVDGCSGSIEMYVEGGVPPYTYTWSNGETNPAISDLCPGEYWVRVRDANGCLEYESFQVELETATSEAFKGSMKILPNPVGNTLSLEIESASRNNIQAEIFNIYGHKVSSSITLSLKEEIDISFLPDGVYVLFLSNGDEHLQRKFIKVTK